jgi:aryl-alcohol dehydrogenase-like predicted oxidoreductase
VDTRRIGALDVSVVGLGCNQFGTAGCDEATSLRVIDEAVDAGITFFDIADEYGMNYFDPTDPEGWGRSEEILGKGLRGRRDEVIVASKFGAHPHADTEGRGGNSARWARIAIEDSLRRLGTDHIDLYQVHFPDPAVPIEETLGALSELVGAGKVREIGCCNFSGPQIREAAEVSAERDIPSFASAQSALNLFRRAALSDEIPTCGELGMAFIPYYPLASGMLTGKYRRGAEPPGGTRLTAQVDDETRRRLFSDRTFARLDALESFARARGHTLLELAFAWLLAQPTVATVIAGAAKPGQAAANAAAGDWHLSVEEAAEATTVVAEAA